MCRLWSTRLAQSTVRTYAAKFTKFTKFCRVNGVCALPATRTTLHLYIAHLSMEGRVQAE